MIILVPQFASLYGEYDRVLGHFRRYSRGTLVALLREAGLEVEETCGFNFLAISGWWVNSRLLRRKRMDRIQIKLLEMMVPVMRVVEAILPLPGLSLICVARKPL